MQKAKEDLAKKEIFQNHIPFCWNGWIVIFMKLEILSGHRNKIYGEFKFSKHKKGSLNLRK